MQGKSENVNLQTERVEKENSNLQNYCKRKIKNFMYTSSIMSLICSGNAILEHDYPTTIVGISCTIGLYSIGKLIGSKIPKIKLYSGVQNTTPIIIGHGLYELEEEKKCYTLSKHHD